VVEVPGDRGVVTILLTHAQVPDHVVCVDVGERLWLHARCSCGKDFSRRKWLKAAKLLVKDVDDHLRSFAPVEEPYDEWEFLPGRA
jgi:acetone carboxylase gamma subunit